MKVTQNGAICCTSCHHHWIYLTDVLKEKYMEAQEMDQGIWKLYYRNVFLDFFDKNTWLYSAI